MFFFVLLNFGIHQAVKSKSSTQNIEVTTAFSNNIFKAARELKLYVLAMPIFKPISKILVYSPYFLNSLA